MARPKKEDAAKVERENRQKALAIIEAIENGLTMRAACRQAEIDHATFRKWVDKFDLSTQYARALHISAELEFDRLDTIAAACEAGKIPPQAASVAADIRKWRLARRRPDLYGDKQKIDLTSSDGTMSPTVTPEQRAERFKSMLQGLRERDSANG